MAWENGGAGSKIPIGIKKLVRDRQGNQCVCLDSSFCTGQIDQFDHIVNIKALRIERKDGNDPNNLQGVCIPCHKKKIQQEALAGRRKHLRPPPPHPGLFNKLDDKQ